MSAHHRLERLWDALEAYGAVVNRVPLDSVTSVTANRLAAYEEQRLRVLAEQHAPAPRRRRGVEHQMEDLLALVHHAVTFEGEPK